MKYVTSKPGPGIFRSVASRSNFKSSNTGFKDARAVSQRIGQLQRKVDRALGVPAGSPEEAVMQRIRSHGEVQMTMQELEAAYYQLDSDLQNIIYWMCIRNEINEDDYWDEIVRDAQEELNRRNPEQWPSQDDEGDDEEYLPEEDYQPGKYYNPRIKKQMGSFVSNDTFKVKGGKMGKRKTPVAITREMINHIGLGEVYRTTKVSGLVEPHETKGRQSAPEPDNQIKVGVKWKEVGNDYTRNTGIVDAQKGHIMALELGGPDVPQNIVPQWAQYQSNGEWRKAEVEVLRIAKEQAEKGNSVRFTCEIFYKQYTSLNQASLMGLTMPTGFKIMLDVIDAKGEIIDQGQVVYNGEQSQDQTDQMLAERVMDKADLEFTEEWNEDD